MGSTVRGRLRGVLALLLSAGAAMAGCGASAGSTPAAAAGSVSASPAPSAVAVSPPVTPSPSSAAVKPKISKAGLSYFFDIALGTEYEGKRNFVVKWERPVVLVRAHGGSGKSRSCLNKVISDFNALSATTDLRLTKHPADIEVHFAPVSKFRSLNPRYIAGNDGFFSVNWSSRKTMTSAIILVRTTGITEKVRCHIIREELTQAMGLGRDSNKYASSVFYGRYGPAPTRYSKIDSEIIRLLYSNAVHAADTKKDVTRAVTVK